MSGITDRETLAIVNLCNMKLEYADLINREGGLGGTKLHTIFSLLEQTVAAIKIKNHDDNPFNYEFGERSGNRVFKDGKILIRPVYEDKYEIDTANVSIGIQISDKAPTRLVKSGLDQLKGDIGLLYGYYLGIKNGNVPNFLDDWEIVYAADIYKLVTDYMEKVFELSKPKFTCSYLEKVSEESEQYNLYVFTVDKLSDNEYVIEDLSKVKKYKTSKETINISEEYTDYAKRKGTGTEDGNSSSLSEEGYVEFKLLAENCGIFGDKGKMYPSRRDIEKKEKLQRILSFGFNTAMFIYDFFPVFSKIKKSLISGKAKGALLKTVGERLNYSKMATESSKNITNNIQKAKENIKKMRELGKKRKIEKIKKSDLQKYYSSFERAEKAINNFNKALPEDKIPFISKEFSDSIAKADTGIATISKLDFESEQYLKGVTVPNKLENFNFNKSNYDKEIKRINEMTDMIEKNLKNKAYYFSSLLPEENLINIAKKYPQYSNLYSEITKEADSVIKNIYLGGRGSVHLELKNLIGTKIRDNITENFTSYNDFLESSKEMNIVANDTIVMERAIIENLISDNRDFEKGKILKELQESVRITPYMSNLKVTNTGFRTVILKNKKNGQYVVGFANSRGSEVEKRLAKNNFVIEGMYLDIVHKLVTEYKLKDTIATSSSAPTTITTGFNIGGELANYYRIRYNCIGKVFLENIQSKERELLNFNLIDMHNIFDSEYIEWFELALQELNSLLVSTVKTTVTGLLTVSFSFGGLIGGAIISAAVFGIKAYGNWKLDNQFKIFYIELCKRGFFNCKKCATPSLNTCSVLSKGEFLYISNNIDENLNKLYPINLKGLKINIQNRNFIHAMAEILSLSRKASLDEVGLFRSFLSESVHTLDSGITSNHEPEEDVYLYIKNTSMRINFSPSKNKFIKERKTEYYYDYITNDMPSRKSKEPFHTKVEEISMGTIGEFLIWVLNNQYILQKNYENLKHKLKLFYIRSLYQMYDKTKFEYPTIVFEDESDRITDKLYNMISHGKRRNSGDILQNQAEVSIESHYQEDLGDYPNATEMIFALGINPETGNIDWQYKVVASQDEITEKDGEGYLNDSEEGSKPNPYEDGYAENTEYTMDRENYVEGYGYIEAEMDLEKLQQYPSTETDAPVVVPKTDAGIQVIDNKIAITSDNAYSALLNMSPTKNVELMYGEIGAGYHIRNTIETDEVILDVEELIIPDTTKK